MRQLRYLVSILGHAFHFQLNFKLNDFLVKIGRKFSHFEIIDLSLTFGPTTHFMFIWIQTFLLEWGSFLPRVWRNGKIWARRFLRHAKSSCTLLFGDITRYSSACSSFILGSRPLICVFRVYRFTWGPAWKSRVSCLGSVNISFVLLVTLLFPFLFCGDARRTFHLFKEFSKLFHFF